MRPPYGPSFWLREHVRGVNTIVVLAGLVVGFSSMSDSSQGTAGWGPKWIGPAIIAGSIGAAWALWRTAEHLESTSEVGSYRRYRRRRTLIPVEWGRVRIMYTVADREMLRGSIAVFLDHEGEWRFHQSMTLRTSYMPGILLEAQLVEMMRKGESPEEIAIDIPVEELASYVDHLLKNMGWRRVSALDISSATEPALPGETPNHAAECDVRRGWSERNYMKGVHAAWQERLHN